MIVMKNNMKEATEGANEEHDVDNVDNADIHSLPLLDNNVYEHD